jgi:hypothetical protein
MAAGMSGCGTGLKQLHVILLEQARTPVSMQHRGHWTGAQVVPCFVFGARVPPNRRTGCARLRGPILALTTCTRHVE